MSQERQNKMAIPRLKQNCPTEVLLSASDRKASELDGGVRRDEPSSRGRALGYFTVDWLSATGRWKRT